VIAVHSSLITKTGVELAMSTSEVDKYYAALGQVPQALEKTVTAGTDATERISMLSATIQYSIGSHRNYTDVIGDLQTAYRNLGISGEPALKFSARIGELANKFGVELNVVKESLSSTTNLLKNYGATGENTGKIMDGAANIMNKYAAALKNTGISGVTAFGIMQNMTSQVAGLDVAQRSFLSQQSGGPGGLRGSFQVEAQIKEGKMDQVMENIQSVMQKQFGKIVTSKEAQGSESAAATAIMQRQWLQDGPLGQFAKSEQDAARILEAFSMRKEGKITEKELSDQVVQTTMDQGLKYQQLTTTHLAVMRSIMESQRRAAGDGMLGLIQQAFAARRGTTKYEETNDSRAMRAGMINLSKSASRGGAVRAATIGDLGTTRDTGAGRTNQNQLENIKDAVAIVGEIGNAVKHVTSSIQSLVNPNAKEEILAEQRKIHEKKLEDARSQYNKETNVTKKEILGNEIDTNSMVLQMLKANSFPEKESVESETNKAAPPKTQLPESKNEPFNLQNHVQKLTPVDNINFKELYDALNTRNSENVSNKNSQASNQPQEVEVNIKPITINVKTKCENCGMETDHKKSVMPV
jgi:hypothetical protein